MRSRGEDFESLFGPDAIVYHIRADRNISNVEKVDRTLDLWGGDFAVRK